MKDQKELSIKVDGKVFDIDDEDLTLLDFLRSEVGITSVKDGCSPQGQCGCCTVLVDGQARVSCVTPVRRVVGREITTIEGLDDETWNEAIEHEYFPNIVEKAIEDGECEVKVLFEK